MLFGSALKATLGIGGLREVREKERGNQKCPGNDQTQNFFSAPQTEQLPTCNTQLLIPEKWFLLCALSTLVFVIEQSDSYAPCRGSGATHNEKRGPGR